MILHHIDGLNLSEEDVDEHFDSIIALIRLGEGLWWLYRDVVQMELLATGRSVRQGD